ncbi:MAG: hypothetical protein HY655_11245 [Acidobacteria bacterium]|nr:hypothetical protein [Acidobacteriota bacterium]
MVEIDDVATEAGHSEETELPLDVERRGCAGNVAKRQQFRAQPHEAFQALGLAEDRQRPCAVGGLQLRHLADLGVCVLAAAIDIAAARTMDGFAVHPHLPRTALPARDAVGEVEIGHELLADVARILRVQILPQLLCRE